VHHDHHALRGSESIFGHAHQLFLTVSISKSEPSTLLFQSEVLNYSEHVFLMFGIIVISLRTIEKPAVLLKNDDILRRTLCIKTVLP
jgi:hypothetical protein